jgi:ribosome biogenesis GTPase / thiamine phosphate phosphatase
LRPPGRPSVISLPLHGEIVAAFGRHFLVKTTDDSTLTCVLRGKKSGAACGDRVEIHQTAPEQGVIERILPRSALLYRSDISREKLIAANATQVIIVVAAVPSFSEELINRCLVAAESQRLNVLIVLNKTDLAGPSSVAVDRLSLYRELGYALLPISARNDVKPLLSHLENHLSVLVGQSGMGKSTIINALVPAAERATADISATLDAGRHTTTHARLYHLDRNALIIDSPGIQQFGLQHLSIEDITWGFREFRPYIGKCKFNNCRHSSEPGCALMDAMQGNKVSVRRIDLYHKLIASLRTDRHPSSPSRTKIQ